MVQHAQADNARLLKSCPDGFALDATHHPHITVLQQFVRTADLGKVYTAANRILADEKVTSWNLKALKYYYIPVLPYGIAGIVVEPTENLLRLQQALLDAVAPFTERTGTAAAFVSADGGRDIQQGLIDYVANFTTVASGKKFNPHVTIGVAPEAYLNEISRLDFQTSFRGSIASSPSGRTSCTIRLRLFSMTGSMTFALVGDCLAPRTALEAIFEGHATATLGGIRLDCLGEFTQLFLLRCMSPPDGSPRVSQLTAAAREGRQRKRPLTTGA